MFFVFGGECYYAKGGMNDLKGKSEFGLEAVDIAYAGMAGTEQRKFHDAWDWFQIVDSTDGKVILQSDAQAHGND